MHSPQNRLAATAVSVLLAAGTVAGLGACGKEPSPEVKPSTATEKVKNLLLLDDATTACVGRGFDANPGAAAALNVETANKPTAGQIDALKALLRSCIAPEAEAELFVSISRTGYPAMTDADASCIRRAVLGLSAQEQDTLLVGGLALTLEGLDMAKLLSQKLVAPCNLQRLIPDDDPSGPVPAGGAGPATPGSTSPPAASATMITRG